MRRIASVAAVTGLLSAVLLLSSIVATLAEAPVQKLRIEIDGKADGVGYIKFSVTPTGSETKVVDVPVADNDRKDAIAGSVAKALSVALGERFRVDTRGGDKVEVKGKEKKDTFTLVVSELSVRGVSVSLD